jgi:hypothetical protein
VWVQGPVHVAALDPLQLLGAEAHRPEQGTVPIIRRGSRSCRSSGGGAGEQLATGHGMGAASRSESERYVALEHVRTTCAKTPETLHVQAESCIQTTNCN